MKLKLAIFYILFMFGSIFSVYADFEGKIVKIIDGDTVDVVTSNYNKIRVRLIDIDAPELKQAYGQASKKQLASFIAGKTVLVKEKTKDIYQRTLGTIFYQNTNINYKMVETGYAWAYRFKGKANNEKVVKLEAEAKRNKLGLWRDKYVTAPWDFRKQHR